MYLPRFVGVLCLSSVALGNLIDDTLSGLKNAATCGACHTLAATLKGIAELGDRPFVDLVTAACKATKVEDDDVCIGTSEEQAPILARVLRNISPFGETSKKICNLVHLCEQPPVNEYTLPIPVAVSTAPVARSLGRQSFQVVHISDLHVDRHYTVSTAVMPKFHTNAPPIRLGLNQNVQGQFVVDPMKALKQCLLKSLLKYISSTKSSFVIFTGDVVEADVWSVTREEVIDDVSQSYQEMLQEVKIPIFPVIGNHEGAPVNSFPTTDTPASDQAGYDPQYVFDTTRSKWLPWINETAADQVRHHSGSYSVVAPGTQLRIISLNTVYWYNLNLWVYDSDKQHPDPNGIMAFAIQELQAAEEAGQKAWIIGHMPPGGPDTLHDQSHYYDQIVQRYKHIIVGHFFGHSHMDQFEIAYSDYKNRQINNAVGVSWIAPSITPRSANSAFKVYDVDPDSYEIMDAKVYVANLSETSFNRDPKWNLYYSARDAYGSLIDLAPNSPLDAPFWHRITEHFEINDDAFQMYLRFMNRGYNVQPCDAACKKATICGMRAMRSEDNCVTGSTLAREARKPVTTPRNSAAHYDSCEATGLPHILAKISGVLRSTKMPEDKLHALTCDLKDIISKHVDIPHLDL